ncbi:glycosyl hydrolase 53 family protein [Lacticaseibacillus paracasei]|uniref:glycosyl hydrolase 53 family protein n=1 Tax=Lacticaseibacillus paracasei TaxID=1597 RepID=UPI001C443601|nr:glycosyl hydrolase 53 family protein [Lacticaseibacillus paracasei]QXJ69432.1 glycosyl hydrolase 53 family protein [Lacticaseibacillus paracasei subsp. paracasei]
MKHVLKKIVVTTLGIAVLACLAGFGGQQSVEAATDSEKPTIRIDKVNNLSPNFIMGADTSTLISEENSGVKYSDFDGQQKDLLTILNNNGVNYVRVRVWNDPYNAKGQGYGAGNADLNNAIKIGQRATKLGMKVLIDFHYSDFWADPGRQIPPKSWQGYSVDQKAQVIYDFTSSSLKKLRDAGVDVGMVQVGNETTASGICGVTGQDEYKLFAKGTQAVRDFDKNILIALHFTNPDKTDTMLWYAKGMADNKIDYDVFATSYYPYWHGSLDNLTYVLKTIANTYDKKVMVAETSYPYTLDDTDGETNVIKTTDDIKPAGYPATPQGQAHALRDVINAVANVGPKALGVFYWEPAWTTVGSANRTANLPIWEKYGSGWASSAVIGYDPTVSATTYGGSQWDNQALFDAKGRALQSLHTFKAVYTGANEQLPDPMLPSDEPAVESLLKNPSFEDTDLSAYQLSGPIKLTQDTPKTGKNALNFYSDDNFSASVSQTIILEAGTYEFSPSIQGGDTDSTSDLEIYADIDGQNQSSKVPALTGWKKWVEPKLTFKLAKETQVKLGLNIKSNAKSWGSTDDWVLTKTENGDATDSGDGSQSSESKSSSSQNESESSQSSDESHPSQASQSSESKSSSSQNESESSQSSDESHPSQASQSTEASSTDQKKKKSLPKTGEEIALGTGVIGIVVFISSLIFYVKHRVD